MNIASLTVLHLACHRLDLTRWRRNHLPFLMTTRDWAIEGTCLVTRRGFQKLTGGVLQLIPLIKKDSIIGVTQAAIYGRALKQTGGCLQYGTLTYQAAQFR